MLGQIEQRIAELLPVAGRFKVEINTVAPIRDAVCQGRLADLTRPKQRDGRQVAKPFLDDRLETPLYHPCNYGTLFRICKAAILLKPPLTDHRNRNAPDPARSRDADRLLNVGMDANG